MIYKEVNDSDGSVNFSVSELTQLYNVPSFSVYYAKGYQSHKTVGGKTLEMSFLNYSWSRIFFSN